jgi:hypothetical protein
LPVIPAQANTGFDALLQESLPGFCLNRGDPRIRRGKRMLVGARVRLCEDDKNKNRPKEKQDD